LYRYPQLNLWVKVKLRRFRKGDWKVYAACTNRGDCQLLEFLDSGADSEEAREGKKGNDPIMKDKRRMVALLNLVAERGPLRNAEISHQIGEDIWQFGGRGWRIRVLWFYGEREIVLSHGFMKKTQQTPAAERQRAVETLRAYRNSLKAGLIERLEE